MLDPYLVDERDVTIESLGEQTYRVEVWVHPSADGAWLAVAVFETIADSVGEVIEWALQQAEASQPARVVVGLITGSGDHKTFLRLYERVVGYEGLPRD